jgi:uncharacterized protein (DUF697 family)
MKKEAIENNETNETLSIEKTLAADNTIKNFILGSMGVGLIPLPVVDFAALTALQIGMLKKLSGIYNVTFSDDLGKSVIGSLVGSSASLLLLGPTASMIKWIPLVGLTVGVVTMPVTFGASTYALGKVFQRHFESGGTLLNFDTSRMKQYYREKFKEGKKVATEVKEEAAAGKA